MLLMMPAEHNSHRNTTVLNSQQHSSHILSLKPNRNGAPLNKRLLAYPTPSSNGITAYKVLTILLEMT